MTTKVSSSLVRLTPSGIGAVERTVEAKLRERPVSVFDFIPPDLHAGIRAGTNTTSVKPYLQAAFAASKHVYFPSGVYECGDVSGGEAICTADGDGGKLSIVNEGFVKLVCNTADLSTPKFFRVIDAVGVKIGTFHFEDRGYDNNHGSFNGAIGCLIEASSGLTLPVKNVVIDALYAKNMGLPLMTAGNSDSVRVEGVKFGLLYCDSTYYGYNAQNNGDGVEGFIFAKAVKRSYLVYGVRGHKIKIYSINNQNSTGDCYITCNIQSSGSARDTQDIDVHYTCVSPNNDFTSGGEVGALVNLAIAKEDSRKLKNIRVHVDIESTSANVKPVVMRCFQSDSITRNTGSTDNVWEDITITGRIVADNAPSHIDIETQPTTRGWLTLGTGIDLSKVSSAVKTYCRVVSPKRYPLILAQSGVAQSVGVTTDETALATITVPANAMGANGALRIWTSWTMTNGADDKTMRVRFSGASGTQYLSNTMTTSASAQFVTTITNRNATNSQVGGSGSSNLIGGSGAAIVTSSVDTTADTTIVITGQKENSADTLRLERYMVELIYFE